MHTIKYDQRSSNKGKIAVNEQRAHTEGTKNGSGKVGTVIEIRQKCIFDSGGDGTTKGAYTTKLGRETNMGAAIY